VRDAQRWSSDYVWNRSTWSGNSRRLAEIVALKTKKPEEFLSEARDGDALLNTTRGRSREADVGMPGARSRPLRNRRGHHDLDAATQAGIIVTNIPATASRSGRQTMALIPRPRARSRSTTAWSETAAGKCLRASDNSRLAGGRSACRLRQHRRASRCGLRLASLCSSRGILRVEHAEVRATAARTATWRAMLPKPTRPSVRPASRNIACPEHFPAAVSAHAS